MVEKFIPVKITGRQWAERLLDGEVFMRPLYEYGSWNCSKEEALNNNFRGDLKEGSAEAIEDVNQHELLRGLDPEFRKNIAQAYIVDDGDPQYIKIFSLYCLRYNEASGTFEKPNPKIREFGDTAVVMKDYNEFIERYAIALFKRYRYVISMIDKITYYSPYESQKLNPFFNKSESYSYQNELRMAFCELQPDLFARGENADEAMSIVYDLNRVTLKIGDIHDIAEALPIEDLLELKFPSDIRLHFPMRDLGEEPSNFDQIVIWTRSQMSNYHTILCKPTVVVPMDKSDCLLKYASHRRTD